MLAGLTYGLVARFAFSVTAIMGVWGIMTLGFIFWLPISLGGYFVWLGTRRSLQSAPSTVLVATLALLPFLSAQIEQNFELPTTHRQVKTEIPIDASPSTVWQNIIRVPTIRDSEQRTISFHVLGFPKPVEATLSHEGVGGIRHASFEGGLVFVETITVWEPDRELAFGIDKGASGLCLERCFQTKHQTTRGPYSALETISISPEVDPELVPATTLDEHVVVGGPFFETLNGHYRIEPLEEGGVVLHLESTHRLSTRFNFYSSWWSDLIMRDIQNYILVILKERCEGGRS